MAKIRVRTPKRPRPTEIPERKENSSLLVRVPEGSPKTPSQPRQLCETPLVSDGHVEASKRVESLQANEKSEKPSLLVLLETPTKTLEGKRNSSLLVREGSEGAPKTPSQLHQISRFPLVSDGCVGASKRARSSQVGERNQDPSIFALLEAPTEALEGTQRTSLLVQEGYEGAPKTLSQLRQLCPRIPLMSNGLVTAQPSQTNERTGEPSLWELEEISEESNELSLSELEENSNERNETSLLKLQETSNKMSVRDQFLQRRKVFAQLLEYYRGEHAKGNLSRKRPDLWTMKAMKVNQQSSDFNGLGDVPGVEVGDIFDFRSEIFMVGLHRQIQGGIASVKHEGERVACSVVVSGDYSDDVDRGRIIEYTGQGGRNYKAIIDRVQLEDQEPKRGNKALINSYTSKMPVRVIRGYGGKSNWNKIYSYDGLYKVSDYKLQKGKDGYLVYKFTLERIPNQPPLNMDKMKLLSSKFRKRK